MWTENWCYSETWNYLNGAQQKLRSTYIHYSWKLDNSSPFDRIKAAHKKIYNDHEIPVLPHLCHYRGMCTALHRRGRPSRQVGVILMDTVCTRPRCCPQSLATNVTRMRVHATNIRIKPCLPFLCSLTHVQVILPVTLLLRITVRHRYITTLRFYLTCSG